MGQSSESQAIEFPPESGLSPSLDIRRARRGFIVTAAQAMNRCPDEYAVRDATEVAELAFSWAYEGESDRPVVRMGELMGAAKDVLIAYGQMSRPKGAGARQLDAAIVGLGRVIGIESFRPEKGPDYGSATGDEGRETGEADSDA